MRILPVIAVLFCVASAAGCQLARSRTSVSFAPDILEITGTAVASDGSPLGAPELFLGSAIQPVGVGEVDGSFSVKADGRALSDWQSQDCPNIRIQSPAGRKNLVAAFVKADPSNRGTLSLGAVTLRKPGSIKGTISKYSQGAVGSGGKSLAGATVTVACTTVTSDASGHFEVKNIPAGSYKLKISSQGLSSFEVDVTVDEDKSTDLKNGVVLYPPGVIDGTAMLSGSYNLPDLIAAGTPYRRTFAMSYSVDVAWVRIDRDKSALIPDGQGNARAPWVPIQGSIDYDFSENGDSTLYYQFASADKSTTSMIRNLVVPLDLFAVSTGFVIGDGSGRVNVRHVPLRIDVPPIARFMRITQKATEIESAQWQPVQALLDYAIIPLPDQVTVQALGSSSFSPSVSGPREVFLQFSDGISKGDNGKPSTSKVFRSTAMVDLFPSSAMPVFTINNGANTTNSNLVRLDIRVPANAWQMRVYEDGNSTSTTAIFGGVVVSSGTKNGVGDWMPANPLFFYSFRDSGLKHLHVQFRDQGGFNSPEYVQTIRVEPFPPGTDPFVINGGDPYTNYRDLLLTINPPANAIVFRVSENSGDMAVGGRLAFLELRPQYPFLVDGVGLRTIYMQFADRDGNTSPVYAKNIYVSPFPPIAGDFHINGSAPVTMSPRLLLDIIPPPAAREMAISDRPFSSSSGGGGGISAGGGGSSSGTIWRPVTTNAEILTTGRGLKTIYLKFRSDGENPVESSVLVRHIIYDPFPPGSVDLVINGGADVTLLPVLNIDITAPPTAYSMSWGFGREELPILNSNSLFEPNLVVQLPRLPGVYHFCLLVDNIDRDESVAVCKTIQLVLFPAEQLVMSLNGEAPADSAPSTSNTTLTIGLMPPPAAEVIEFQQIATTDVGPSFATSSWVRLPQDGEAPLSLTVTGGVGVKRICARYGSGVGVSSGSGGFPSSNPQAMSAPFCKDIEIIP